MKNILRRMSKMAAKKTIPKYSMVEINGSRYYKTYVEDADGKRVILYGKTREEWCPFLRNHQGFTVW